MTAAASGPRPNGIGPPPATGAWRAGDPPGARRFADLGSLELQLGGRLPAVRLAYETWGTLDADGSNAVLVEHALTGDSHVVGDAGPGQPTPGWWPGLIGPGAPLDTARWFVVAANVLGGASGSTGPASTAPDGRPWGSRFPRITIRDQVAAEDLLRRRLGVPRWACVMGGSMGGMRALEWAVGRPVQVTSALVVAVGAAATADQIGTQSTQIDVIRADPRWRGGDYYDAPPGEGPHLGLGLARKIAHLTYRSGLELEDRFGRQSQPGEDPLGHGRFAVQSYLDHHADKLAWRFDAGSYVALTDAMNTWDVGHGRGGTARALRQVTAGLIVAGVDSDRLYPLHLQEEIVAGAPTAVGGLRVISSPSGHDGFLLAVDQVGGLVTEAVGYARRARAA